MTGADRPRHQLRERADARGVLADLAYGGVAFSLSAACCSSLWEEASSRSSGWPGVVAQALLFVGQPVAAILFAACGLFFVACAGWTAGAMRASSSGG